MSPSPIPISARKLVEFVPAQFNADARAAAEARGDENLARFDAPPTLLFSVPTLAERAEFRRKLAVANIKYPSDDDLVLTLCDGVRAMLEPENAAQWLERIELFSHSKDDMVAEVERRAADLQKIAKAAGEDSPEYAEAKSGLDHAQEQLEALRRDMGTIEEEVGGRFIPYREMRANRGYANDLLPICAVQSFLRGWKNIDTPFRRSMEGVPDDLMLEIQDYVAEAGWFVYNLAQPTKAVEKNSASSSPST